MFKKALSIFILSLTLMVAVPSMSFAHGIHNYGNWQENGVVGSGSSGNLVKAVQSLMYHYGYGSTVGSIDGVYGSNTKSAIIKFQQSRGLAADGVFGQSTWKSVERDLIRIGTGYVYETKTNGSGYNTSFHGVSSPSATNVSVMHWKSTAQTALGLVPYYHY